MTPTTFRELDTVVLDRDVPELGLQKGDLGAIVHVHDQDTFEVEFVRASGETQALVTLKALDLRAITDHDIPTVRPTTPRPHGSD
jgi:hypothetical protein